MPESELAAAVARVQAKLPTVAKHQTAQVRSDKGSYSYDYADLSDVTEVILPLLGAEGLSWICRPTLRDDGKFVLAYALVHTSGEREEGAYPLPSTGTPQVIGGHITYARRYALCAVTGVAPKGDDDDAAEASTAGRPRPAQRATRPRQQPQPQRAVEPPAGEDTPEPPRTAQRATRPQGPPLPGEDSDTESAGPAMISGRQRGMMLALFDKAGVVERGERLDITRRVVGRDVASANDLTRPEAGRVIDWLTQADTGGFTNALSELLTATETPTGDQPAPDPEGTPTP